MTARYYDFTERKSKTRRVGSSRELRALLLKQRRWMTKIKRAVTAISKIERQIKRLE